MRLSSAHPTQRGGPPPSDAARSLPLDPLEVAAIPELMRRRSAFGLIHWIGRHRQGIAPQQEPLDRVARGAMLTRWLDLNAARVAATVAGGFKPKPV